MIGRRAFVRGLTAAGAAGWLGLHPESAAADPPPETTTAPHAKKELKS